MNRFRPSNLALARPGERGVTILLIAVAMLFMVLAIAAIAIDVGAMYSARAEAKHATDAAALAGAKVLADSGMTSETGPTGAALQTQAKLLATQIATSVATQNKVGGRTLTSGEVTVLFPNSGNANFVITPQVSVTVQRTDLPTFFAKAWGRSTVAVGATSVAEAVNPSNSGSVTSSGNPVPIAPSCVKPWIIPNWNPNAATPFFDPATGAIKASGMVGAPLIISPRCSATGCTAAQKTPASKKYYPASLTTPPANQEPSACTLACDYEENIAACSPQPITCGVSQNAAVDFSSSCANFNASTNTATSCLIHSPGQDTIEVGGSPPSPPLSQPMQFVAGADNPLVTAGKVSADTQVTASDSVVTIPVYDGANLVPSGSTAPVNVIGFIQGFVKSVTATGHITIFIVNMSGCGTGATGLPVVGNGLSPVPVHLITPP